MKYGGKDIYVTVTVRSKILEAVFIAANSRSVFKFTLANYFVWDMRPTFRWNLLETEATVYFQMSVTSF